MTRFRWIAAASLLTSVSVAAAPPSGSVSVPPPMQQPAPAEARDYFRCNREFAFQGKTYDCDSLVRQDGEGLRPIVADTPQAISELDHYQSTRRKARAAAYVGTLGLVAAITGVMMGKGGSDAGVIVAVSGLSLAGASLIYGVSLIRTNESHLNNAVQMHNDAHPDRPIELKFSTGFTF